VHGFPGDVIQARTASCLLCFVRYRTLTCCLCVCEFAVRCHDSGSEMVEVVELSASYGFRFYINWQDIWSVALLLDLTSCWSGWTS
jgi:hypothetical protein